MSAGLSAPSSRAAGTEAVSDAARADSVRIVLRERRVGKPVTPAVVER